jgi:hypothetical protein
MLKVFEIINLLFAKITTHLYILQHPLNMATGKPSVKKRFCWGKGRYAALLCII